MGSLSKLSVLTAFLFIVSLRIPVSAFQYEANGENGWVVPNVGDESAYNHWASSNRFTIGDTVRFIYDRDSLMEVTADEYDECNSPHPILFSNSGDTVVELNRSGTFYFISGISTHCLKGQKMIIKVLSIATNAPSESPSESPSSPPAAKTNGNDASAPAPPKSSDAVATQICLVWWIWLFVGSFFFF